MLRAVKSQILTAVYLRFGEYWSSRETRSIASGGVFFEKIYISQKHLIIRMPHLVKILSILMVEFPKPVTHKRLIMSKLAYMHVCGASLESCLTLIISTS